MPAVKVPENSYPEVYPEIPIQCRLCNYVCVDNVHRYVSTCVCIIYSCIACACILIFVCINMNM